MLLTLCTSLSTEDRLPGSLTVLSREHWCHNADNQSDSKGQSFYLTSCIIVIYSSPSLFYLMDLSYIHSFLCQDLSSPNQYDTGVALTGLSCFVTPDLARDLANDIMTLVSHVDTVNGFFIYLFIFYISVHPITTLISLFTSNLWSQGCYFFYSLPQMSHTKPYIRKKAVLIMYKVFLKYPESLRPAFPRLKEKLEDPDPGMMKITAC